MRPLRSVVFLLHRCGLAVYVMATLRCCGLRCVCLGRLASSAGRLSHTTIAAPALCGCCVQVCVLPTRLLDGRGAPQARWCRTCVCTPLCCVACAPAAPCCTSPALPCRLCSDVAGAAPYLGDHYPKSAAHTPRAVRSEQAVAMQAASARAVFASANAASAWLSVFRPSVPGEAPSPAPAAAGQPLASVDATASASASASSSASSDASAAVPSAAVPFAAAPSAAVPSAARATSGSASAAAPGAACVGSGAVATSSAVATGDANPAV